MLVRPATIKDIPKMLELGRAMHAESRFSHLPYSDDKIRALTNTVFTDDRYCAFVCEDNGVVFGMFVGFYTEFYFSSATRSCDLLLYVNKLKRSGSLAFFRLLRSYEQWAKDNNVDEIELGSSAGINDAAYVGALERIGYKTSAYLLKKEM